MLSVAMIAWAALAVGCATAQPTATATPVVNEWGATYRMFIETICADARTLARGLVSAHPQAPLGFVTASITPERIHETIITLAQTDNERLDALGYDVNKALVLLGVCPRIRSWRRKPLRNNLLTVIWTLSWSN